MSQDRIVSLIPSATEIVAALGFQDRLVGRSHECDFPPAVQQLSVCSKPKINVNGTSRQIDERVKDVLKDALSIYRVDADMLRSLQPTLIITQTQCEVCAVSLKDVEQAVDGLVGSRPKIVSLEPHNLGDLWTDIRAVANALSAITKAEPLIDLLQRRLTSLAQQTSPSTDGPTVTCIEWINPLMAAGNWVPELVEIAGGINLFGKSGQHSPWMTWDDLVARDPDVIAVMPCGFDISRSRREMHMLCQQAQWQNLKAVKSNRVYLSDGNQFFNRPGPRLVESAEILAEICYPGRFDFGHRGSGWEPFRSAIGSQTMVFEQRTS